jgi:ParB-like chromosome segregation protein Spo0J
VVNKNDESAWEHAIIENIVRADLGPLKEAEAIQKLMQS